MTENQSNKERSTMHTVRMYVETAIAENNRADAMLTEIEVMLDQFESVVLGATQHPGTGLGHTLQEKTAGGLLDELTDASATVAQLNNALFARLSMFKQRLYDDFLILGLPNAQVPKATSPVTAPANPAPAFAGVQPLRPGVAKPRRR